MNKLAITSTSDTIAGVKVLAKIPINLQPTGRWARLSAAAEELNINSGTLTKWMQRGVVSSKTEGSATFIDMGEATKLVQLHRKYGADSKRLFRERGFAHIPAQAIAKLPAML